MLQKIPKVTEMAGFGTSFGRLIREKRGVEGMSQEALATHAGVTKARISDLENGKINNPQARTVDALCVALNISQDERADCYEQDGVKPPRLPPLLLENLSLRFGHCNPDAREDDLLAFLNEKAVAFASMKQRLSEIDADGTAIAKLTADASAALEIGDFQTADLKLAEAESSQLASGTLPAIDAQWALRFERGNAALLAGCAAVAAEHWETAASYYHFFDVEVEADRRFEGSVLLREHAYRFRDADALRAAGAALRKNLTFWTREHSLAKWCKATNALGGVYWRLSQFDDPAHFEMHMNAAHKAYSEVHESTGSTKEAYYHRVAEGNLANIYSDSAYAEKEDFVVRLKTALDLLEGAIEAIERAELPTEWGVLQHNLGCTYIKLFNAQPIRSAALYLIDKAIAHLQLSFQVRDTEDSLQYWIASCRSMAEALITGAPLREPLKRQADLQRASQILSDALSRIRKADHPNQWKGLKDQQSILLKELEPQTAAKITAR